MVKSTNAKATRGLSPLLFLHMRSCCAVLLRGVLLSETHYIRMVNMSKRSKWKRFRPGSNDELESALLEDRKLTARWYERISGQIHWGPGERGRLNASMEAQAKTVNSLIQQQAAEQFVSLPDE